MAARYMLRLDKGFFEKPECASIEAMPSGKDYMLLYFKLLCKCGEVLPCDRDYLARLSGETPDDVQTALNTFHRHKLLTLVEATAEPPFPPTFEDIRLYCEELKSPVDPQKFYDWYAADGFTFHGEPIDWRAKLRQWTVKERAKYKGACTPLDDNKTRAQLDELRKRLEGCYA